jgi:hypothetical protein
MTAWTSSAQRSAYETWQQYGLGQWNIYVEERERRAREHMKSRNTS